MSQENIEAVFELGLATVVLYPIVFFKANRNPPRFLLTVCLCILVTAAAQDLRDYLSYTWVGFGALSVVILFHYWRSEHRVQQILSQN